MQLRTRLVTPRGRRCRITGRPGDSGLDSVRDPLEDLAEQRQEIGLEPVGRPRSDDGREL